MNRRAFKASDLRVVSAAPPADNPPLMMGEFCELNSGSPPLLIVDIQDDDLIVSWRCDCGVTESKMPRTSARRKARD